MIRLGWRFAASGTLQPRQMQDEDETEANPGTQLELSSGTVTMLRALTLRHSRRGVGRSDAQCQPKSESRKPGRQYIVAGGDGAGRTSRKSVGCRFC